jgi:proliferating cell nuclear antigen
MFSAIASAKTLDGALDTVSALVDECTIHLTDDGLVIRAVDPANVGMVDLSLDAPAFESYEADGGQIGVDLVRLQDVLGMADADQLVHLELDDETKKLHIRLGDLDYTLALIDPDNIREDPDIPDLDLPATVVVEGRDINRGVKATGMVSDHITLGVDEEESVFYVEAAGDTDSVDLRLDRDELIGFTPGPAHSRFSLGYLGDMNSAIPTDGEVTIELGEEFPVKLHFEIADGTGAVTYLVAPRIDNE